MELISIIDCDLCVTLPDNEEVLDPPLPETWGRLTTILVKGSWQMRWFPAPVSYSSHDIEEIRVCRACGTHYHYHQIHDPNFGEPLPPETKWLLWRIGPDFARTYISQMGPDGVVVELDGGWLEQRYDAIIELLRRDLLRAPDLPIKEYMVESLYRHYVGNQDWQSLKAVLIDCPDLVVGVYVARRIFEVIEPDSAVRFYSPTQFNTVNALLGADPTREPLLVAALARGLSAQGQILRYFLGKKEPVNVSSVAMHVLQEDVPGQNLAPAVPALAAELQQPDSTSWWRETARDLLIEYVGTEPDRAKDVLDALDSDTDEARAVRRHCQTQLE